MILKVLILKLLRICGYDIVHIPSNKTNHKLNNNMLIGRFHLSFPVEHDFQFNYTNYPLYQRNLQRLAEYLSLKFNDFSMIDVGANIGDSAILINQNIDIPVLCIEGDENFYLYLMENIKQIHKALIHKAFLYDGQRKAGSFDKRYEGGTMRLVKNDSDQLIQFSTLDEVLTSNPLFQKSKLFKIDTDGQDIKVLYGAREYLSLAKPVLFFEFDREFMENAGDNGLDALKWLSQLGYHQALFYDNFGMLLLSVSLDKPQVLKQLYNYIQKKHAAFPYFDICLFHFEDNIIADEFVDLENLFFEEVDKLPENQ